MTAQSSNLVASLFPEDAIADVATVETIVRKLGEYGVQNLAYDGDHGSNPGYIFRGEADFEIPLQSSVERQWRYAVSSSAELSGDALREQERDSLGQFLKSEGPQLAGIVEPSSGLKSWDEVWWWLSLMQHYERRTRLIDFTRDIRVALYFAIEQHEKRLNGKKQCLDLIIYCFPCRDLQHPHDLESNKCPYHPTSLCKGVDMNLVIGRQLKLSWMEPHQGWFPDKEPEKYFKKTRRKWGWDMPHYQNPRIKFQKGMFVYPYDYPEDGLKKIDCDSWLVRNLRRHADPFFLGKNLATSLVPKRIRIPHSHASALKTHLRERYRLTTKTIYLDYDRTL